MRVIQVRNENEPIIKEPIINCPDSTPMTNSTNTKFEARNTKQITNTKSQCSKPVWNLGFGKLDIV